MSIFDFSGDNPFLLWLFKVDGMRALEVKPSGSGRATRDFIVDERIARRFGLGIAERIPYLGYVDQEAVEAVRWTSAAILLGKKQRDFIALSSLDSRPDIALDGDPLPVRLFIPVAGGRLSAWKEAAPKELAIGPLSRNEKGDAVFAASPFRTLPMKIG